MSFLNSLLIFAGGIGVGCGFVLFLLIYVSIRGNKQSQGGICSDAESHDFTVKAAFTGTVAVCSNCGLTILSPELFQLSERDIKIVNYMLEEGGSLTTIAQIKNMQENI